ncbi:MAG: hypothetical protein OXC13_02700 [Caldilineaceae bacterium]|nr:hypothetical protein [Caldilineaceae bacterium]
MSLSDTVHDHSGRLRSWLEARDQSYLLAVPAHETFLVGRYEVVVREVFAALAEEDWQRLSAGPGNKGERWYDWQCLVLAEAADADKGHYLCKGEPPEGGCCSAVELQAGPEARACSHYGVD